MDSAEAGVPAATRRQRHSSPRIGPTLQVNLKRDPGLGNEQLFVEIDGESIGHAGEKVASRRVEALRLDCATVQEVIRSLAHLLPETPENPCRFGELGCGNFVFVDGVEEEAAKADGRLQNRCRSSGSR